MSKTEEQSQLTEILNHVAFGQEQGLKLLDECEDVLDIEIAKKSDEDIKKHGTIKWKDAKDRLGL